MKRLVTKIVIVVVVVVTIFNLVTTNDIENAPKSEMQITNTLIV